jgi:hypothetical protein
VGSRIELTGTTWSAVDAVNGGSINDLRNIAHADYEIREHEDTSVTATLTELKAAGPGIASSRSMSFFFHKPGSYLLTVQRPEGKREEVKYTVSAPTAEITRMTQAAVSLYLRDDHPMLNLGTRGDAGLEFDIDIDMGNCGGTIADVQTLSFRDIEGRQGSIIRRFDTRDEIVLDYEPGVHSTWQYSFRGAKEAGDTLSQTYRDSPKVFPAEDMLCLSNEAEFHYYVIYRPADTGAAWVPVSELDWQFEIYASRPDVETPWVGGDGVAFGGRSWATPAFAPTIRHWPVWSRSWTAVEASELAGSCAGRSR